MVERQLPKLHTGVRFPSPAHFSAFWLVSLNGTKPKATLGSNHWRPGIGEIGITGIAAAEANAVYHATEKRVRKSRPIS